jgi:hypothetical protein
MPFPPNATVYTFNSIQFVRLLQGDDFAPWAFGEIQYTKDAVLGGSKIYLDIGADVAPAFSFRALVLTPTDRFNLRNSRGITATLSNTRGRSDSMTLIKASPVDGPANQYWIELTFELRPS